MSQPSEPITHAAEKIHLVAPDKGFTLPDEKPCTPKLVVIIVNNKLRASHYFEATPEENLQAEYFFCREFRENIGHAAEFAEDACKQGYAGRMDKYYIAITTPTLSNPA